jgi:hypothetical protein
VTASPYLLGAYLAVVVLAAAGAWVWFVRLLLPDWRRDGFDWRHAIGCSAAASLLAHALTFGWAWGVRTGTWAPQQWVLWVLVGTAGYAEIVGIAGLSHAITGRARVGMILAAAAVLWGAGVWVSS